MTAGSKQERVNDQFSIVTGSESLASNLTCYGENVITDGSHHSDGIRARIVETLADDFGIPGQWRKGDAMLGYKIFETMGRSEFDLMAGILQTDRKREKGLYITTRAVGENRDSHNGGLKVLQV